jgi:hypothetical protein
MRTKRGKASLRVAGVVLAAALLGACVVRPGPYGGAYVSVAPPPVRVEVVGEPPVPGYLWIGGYWGWVGDRHEWIPGRWEAPRPGYRYVPHAWVHEAPGWRLEPGRWERGEREHERDRR